MEGPAKAESPVGRWFIHVYPIYDPFIYRVPSWNPKSYPGAGVRNHPQDSSLTFHLLEANFGETEAGFWQV